MLLQPSILHGHGKLVSLSLAKRFRPGPQICPTSLDFHQGLGMAALGFDRVTSLKTTLLFALADKLAQVFKHSFFGAKRRRFWDVSRDETLQGHVPPVYRNRSRQVFDHAYLL
jgi:hypothetical protein